MPHSCRLGSCPPVTGLGNDVPEPPLTEPEKRKLQAEEEWKAAIRQEIEGRASKNSPVWAFMNSAFFLWALSTIVLGLATKCYSDWRQEGVEQRARQQLIGRLDIEIASRLLYASLAWSVGPDSLQNQQRARIVVSLMRPDSSNFPFTVFPELASRSLPSLIWELRRELKDSSSQKLDTASAAQLDSALADSRRLLNVYLELQTAKWQKNNSPPVSSWFRILHRSPSLQVSAPQVFRNFNLARWDCPFGRSPTCRSGPGPLIGFGPNDTP